MSKSIIKEIIIILLLCLAIIVVLGLLLYDYVPMAKVVPEPVSYTTPEDVKEELVQAGEVDDNQVIMTYEVNSSDLNNYEKIKNLTQEKQILFLHINHKQMKMEMQQMETQLQQQEVQKIQQMRTQIQIQQQIIQVPLEDISSKIKEQNKLVINVIFNIT